MPSDLRFDTYYKYADLTRLLHAFAEEHPTLVKIISIGHSHEGRDIWLTTITNTATGPDTEKPALWVDGNLPAQEPAPSTALLFCIHTLLTRHAQNDPDTLRCLDTRAFYVCPRANPDGAEWALADTPKLIRSSTRPYPYDEDPRDGGLAIEDIDGDGRIRQMRLKDPTGPWKVATEDPRLLVRRDPTEAGGTYYRVFVEGRVHDY